MQFIPNINFVGGPASSVVAELYMQNQDIRALTTFENSPRIYERFVDTSLKRKPDGTISVLVYRKQTHTDQYLNYNSNLPAKTKDAVVSALFRRAKDRISDKDDLEKENFSCIRNYLL